MIWFNGQLTSNARIAATSAGTLLGWGVFTTLAIRGGAPHFWSRHVARLQRDAQAARVDLPFDDAQLRDGLNELLSTLEISDGLARITGTRRGDGRWNAQNGADWSIIATPSAIPSEPLRLQISEFRVAANAPLAGVKTTSYLPYLLAGENARDAGFDEALLLCENGWVCETARASIFWARDGALCTPSLDCGCLRGVGRDVALGWRTASEEKWTLDELLGADEAFTVSATGVRAVRSIGERDLDAPGDLTRQLQSVWANLD